ncbi:hypothetical protein DL95DRAFT_411631 [Leptodontidium sp. 2 PMI_412]|nr:hypothetical protein DL95DRAFT_411631 [Leptodontidium sp. 2 PMI_412]
MCSKRGTRMICGHLVTSDNEARIIYCNAALKAFKEAKEDATALDEDRTDSEREALQEWYQQDERTRGAAPYQSPEDFEYREVTAKRNHRTNFVIIVNWLSRLETSPSAQVEAMPCHVFLLSLIVSVSGRHTSSHQLRHAGDHAPLWQRDDPYSQCTAWHLAPVYITDSYTSNMQ